MRKIRVIFNNSAEVFLNFVPMLDSDINLLGGEDNCFDGFYKVISSTPVKIPKNKEFSRFPREVIIEYHLQVEKMGDIQEGGNIIRVKSILKEKDASNSCSA